MSAVPERFHLAQLKQAAENYLRTAGPVHPEFAADVGILLEETNELLGLKNPTAAEPQPPVAGVDQAPAAELFAADDLAQPFAHIGPRTAPPAPRAPMAPVAEGSPPSAPQAPAAPTAPIAEPRVRIRARDPRNQPIAELVADLVNRYMRGEVHGVARQLVELALQVEQLELDRKPATWP